jgi:DNA-binding transcriptional MerR regulator
LRSVDLARSHLREPFKRNSLGPRKRETVVLVERIRHWTREGLITPIGEKNPGTGQHREYHEDVLPDVALLNILADTGIQVSVLHHILNYVHNAKSQTRRPSKENLDYIICIRLGESQKRADYAGFFVPTDQEKIAVPKTMCGDAAIMINISQIERNSIEAIEE